MRRTWLLLAFAVAAPVFGEPLVLHLDPAATRIEFTLGDVLHTVHGSFRLKCGEIRVDPATGAATGSVIVDAQSGNSGSSGRDSRMHKNILESDKYPDITFVPDRMIGTLDMQRECDVQLHGMFTIHGSAHELTMPVHTTFAGEQISASTHFPVPYVKWGMKNPSNFILRVNDTVQIEMQMQMEPPMQAPTSAHVQR